jgi:hypothetical protein
MHFALNDQENGSHQASTKFQWCVNLCWPKGMAKKNVNVIELCNKMWYLGILHVVEIRSPAFGS